MSPSERAMLLAYKANAPRPRRYGGPLAMLGLVLSAWVTGRSVLWENPLPGLDIITEAKHLLAETSAPLVGPAPQGFDVALAPDTSLRRAGRSPDRQGLAGQSRVGLLADSGPSPAFGEGPLDFAGAHHNLWYSAVTSDPRGASWYSKRAAFEAPLAGQASVPVFPGSPPFTGRSPASDQPNRWLLGVWAFGRQGSGSAPVSQGRVPVYGTSQLGAHLQFRLAPDSARDPRLYLRAYRALIDRAETEIAAGGSVRPLSKVPVRVAAEVRATDNHFGRDVRPAAFAVTEIPPLDLPLDLTGEVYAGAGYVAGDANTTFFDGQATVTRRLTSLDFRRADDTRISFGGGAWGGAQRGASRLDIGPTVRVDLALGAVPARLSLDYRERVGGDAAPESGVAATLSTQF
ncbi:MAG: hypothetical protein QNI87_15665 [Erythrobacter sp.]|uniref:hypothetical protein n=1 Tax=Erythrobacter sp. TaxID=1042 RepID=UPI0026343833|nr:hypothetical protein [Erythrobacter sp.]MDJ0979963.1 hypothetical protein [Erythrobacter sp.]